MNIIMSVETNKAGAPNYSTAEPIVQCSGCKYCKMKRTTFRGEPFIYYKCKLLEREVEGEDFCAWGDEK